MNERKIKQLFHDNQIVYVAKGKYKIAQHPYVGKLNGRNVAILRDYNGGLIQYSFGWIFSTVFQARVYSLGVGSNCYLVPKFMQGTGCAKCHKIKGFRVADSVHKGKFVRKLYVMNESNIEIDSDDIFVSRYEAKMHSANKNKLDEDSFMKHYLLEIPHRNNSQEVHIVCFYIQKCGMDFSCVLN